MINALRRKFLRCKRHKEVFARDEELLLKPRQFLKIPYTMENCEVWIFDLCVENQTVGELALRIGEGDAIFYLGHIGYHVDPPFRGHHYAARACKLVEPVFVYYGMRSWVITTDSDNIPSMKTCLGIGYVHESTVAVPRWCQKAYGTGTIKERFVFLAKESKTAYDRREAIASQKG